ncbi:MAG: GAF domain-containing protein, partial [Deltaproteobacteria bacterium]|nr:GAF domain-containing protein [Deltaproteobacteria bacterium]
MSVKTSNSNRSPHDRRKSMRRAAKKGWERSVRESKRKLKSLLELGQIIGLDLDIDGTLLKIAQKAAEVMEADRCSLFLYDPNTDELWSTVTMELEGHVIRIPSDVGLAGACFQAGQTINLKDAYKDPRFNKEVDARTGYRTRSVLSMPIYNRAGETLGVIQLLNKKDRVFTEEDETFLQTFGNHASVFIEMAQLQKARFEALERSREEFRQLNKAKDRALHHLSHELRTPLSVIQGTIRLLQRRFQTSKQRGDWKGLFETLEKHLNRLIEIQQETDTILRAYHELQEAPLHIELDWLWRRLEDAGGIPPDLRAHWNSLKERMAQLLPDRPPSREQVRLFPFVQRILEKVGRKANHRDIHLLVEGEKDLLVSIDQGILEVVMEGLLKNAIENTPDGGTVRILMERGEQEVLLQVQDSGIGISDENQRHIFEGFFPTQETDLYSSKSPYDFDAGGKGLDLFRMKVYGQRFGFGLSVTSRRCIHLPTDRDLCWGKISACPHCRRAEDCSSSGGSTFCVSFP